jgi:hypothetical protein
MFAEAFWALFLLGLATLFVVLIVLILAAGARRSVRRDHMVALKPAPTSIRSADKTAALAITIDGLKTSLATVERERDEARTSVLALERELADATNRLGGANAELKRLQTASSSETPPAEPQRVNAHSPMSAPPHAPTIVTRTTNTSTGVRSEDFAELTWTQNEDSELLGSYLRSRDVASVAVELRIDQLQVAARLVRLLLEPDGDIHNPSSQNWGKKYAAAHTRTLLAMWGGGEDLATIAAELERDQLGIGWKLLDHPSQPVELDQVDIPKIARFTTFGRA